MNEHARYANLIRNIVFNITLFDLRILDKN